MPSASHFIRHFPIGQGAIPKDRIGRVLTNLQDLGIEKLGIYSRIVFQPQLIRRLYSKI